MSQKRKYLISKSKILVRFIPLSRRKSAYYLSLTPQADLAIRILENDPETESDSYSVRRIYRQAIKEARK